MREPAPRRRWWQSADVFLRWREVSIVAAGSLLIVYFQSTSAFLSVSNIGNLVDYTATTAIIAAGEVMVLVVGELDLSVGMVYAFAPFVMFFTAAAGAPMWLAVVAALAAAGRRRRQRRDHHPARRAGLRHHARHAVRGQRPDAHHFRRLSGAAKAGALFTALFGGSVWARFGWAVAIALVLQFVLTRTRFGLHTIATGGNLIGAAEVGIKVRRIKAGNFILCSVLGGFAGIIDAFRIGSIDPLAGGSDIMFAAIAAAVIGGTLLTGGLAPSSARSSAPWCWACSRMASRSPGSAPTPST